MDERKAFTSLLQDMLEQAQINGNQISQQEIQEYFEDLNLSDEQMNHVYSYLVAHRITVKGFVPSAGTRKKSRMYEEAEQTEEKETDIRDEETEQEPESAFLKMYLRELRTVEKLTKAQEQELANRLVELAKQNGNQAELEELKERFINHKLRYVVNRARKYALGGEALDELVQEGNIGLMTAMQQLTGQSDAASFLAAVEEQITRTMEQYINEIYASGSEEQAMVAKVHFVSEAAKALKEENGQEPTLAEMAAYTNLTEEELIAIINLSADNLKA